MAENSPRCPQCKAVVTRAYSVQYGQGEKTVSYHCDACGHEWQVTKGAEPGWPPVSRD